MKAPDAALLRARAKAPLPDLQALHLSSADLACLRHLESCRQLRSLYANANVLRDIACLAALRRLWRIDLRDNALGAGASLSSLASFAALGFLHLERNQLRFDDLVCLRDVHILDLRLAGNRELLQLPAGDAVETVDRLAATTECRMKAAALLPYAWTLDGHYVSTSERAQALEAHDDWVLHLLARHGDGSAGGTLRFGSTSDTWGIANVADDDLGHPVQEDTLKLLQIIERQPTRQPEQQDLYRLRAIAGFHDSESDVHNAHTQFAPFKHAATAKPMPKIRLRQLQALPRRTRLELGMLLAATLDVALPTKLLTEALTIALLSDGDGDSSAAAWVHDLVLLPPYAVVALLSVLRQQALGDADQACRTRNKATSIDQLDNHFWKAVPAVVPTLLHSEHQSKLVDCDAPDQLYLQRCAFAVCLLARTAAFPPTPSPATHGELHHLVEAAKLASTAVLESLGVAIPIVLVGDSSSSEMPWKQKKNWKKPDREYRKPWQERPEPVLVVVPAVTTMTSDREVPRRQKRQRLPKSGEWLEVRPKHFFKIRSVSPEGDFLTASPATARDVYSALITLRVDDIVRVSSSMWRLTTDDPAVGDEISYLISTDPAARKSCVGKLHRDSEAFHKHGASRNQGYPNRDVSVEDLHQLQLPQRDDIAILSAGHARPVEVFSATDTLDANYVLTSPALIAMQNAVASQAFHEQRRIAAGLWNPIETASFRVAEPQRDTTHGRTLVERPSKSKTTSKLKKTASLRHQTKADRRELQRDMQSLLGLCPPTPVAPLSGASDTDVRCFMTAVPTRNDDADTCHDKGPPFDVSPPTLAPTSAATDDRALDHAHAPHYPPCSTTKPRKLASLAWHQVATKPQLLVAAGSPTMTPLKRSDASLESTTRAMAHVTPGPEPLGGATRPSSSLTRCHVSLPTLSLVSQK